MEEHNWQNFYKEVIDGETHTLVSPPVNDGNHFNVNRDINWLTANGYTEWTDEQIEQWHEQYDPKPVITVQDYDDAMEAHLDSELTARGYTKRSPIEYTNSTNARWKQDAIDWQKHLDEVMTYGLEVMNKYEAGETVPTLDEFKAALPKITWTVNLTVEA